MAKKPAPKPVRKPAPKAPKLKGPDMAPINAVRNPNFGAAMAQQDYFNNLSRLIAERNARGPEYGLMPIGNPEDARRMEAAMAERNAALTSGTAQPVNDPEFIDSRQPGSNYSMNMINYVDPATGQMVARTAGIVPRAGSRFVPVERFQTPNQMPIGGTGISAEQMQNLTPERRQAPDQAMLSIEQFQRNLANQMPINGQNATAYQRNADGSLVPVQAPRPIEGDQRLPIQVGVQPNLPSNFIGQVPQNSQMQNYNNFLQQGMQNSNTLNQGAMANFANMQPGMQAPQQARPTAPNQAMPVAGMGMQQPKQTSLPRKLSTFSNTPARFV